MARIIGGIGTSHVPTIGMAFDKGKQNDPDWKPLFRGYERVARWLEEKKPDVLFFCFNDHRLNLTPVATAEAMWLARTLFRNEPTPVDHDNVPTAVFSNPNVATVGLSEERAREKFGAVDVYKTSFRALKLTLGEKKERTFMKLVVDRASQKVVGAHMIGPDAGEVIQGIAIAVKLGATKAQFDSTIGIHPTAAEEFVTLRERVSVG